MNLPHPKPLPATIPTVSLANLTLLLILFFVLTTTYDIDRTPVQLPDGPAESRAEPGTACLVVTTRVVDGNELVEYRFSDGGLQTRLLPGLEAIYLEASRTMYRDPNQTVLLRADRAVRWAIVDRALDALERAGATRVVFATAPG